MTAMARAGALLLGLLATLPACAQDPPGSSEQVLEVAVTVPDPCWSLRIRAVYRTAAELLVVSDLSPPPPDLMCAQVITQARDRVELALPHPLPPIRHLVLGRTWRGELGPDRPPVTFLDSEARLQTRLAGAERLR